MAQDFRRLTFAGFGFLAFIVAMGGFYGDYSMRNLHNSYNFTFVSNAETFSTDYTGNFTGPNGVVNQTQMLQATDPNPLLAGWALITGGLSIFKIPFTAFIFIYSLVSDLAGIVGIPTWGIAMILATIGVYIASMVLSAVHKWEL